MHNALFFIVCIKSSEGAKALYIAIYTHIHVYAPQDVCRKITTPTQGNGSDRCYIEAYTYQQTNYEEQRLIYSQACRNSTTSVLTLNASERLYQPISLFTYCYLHVVHNSIIYNTNYKLSHKHILIWRSTHDIDSK